MSWEKVRQMTWKNTSASTTTSGTPSSQRMKGM
jgi:hypothetical protein